MTRRILEWTTGRPATVMIIALLIAGLGIWSFVNLQIDVIPDITGVQVQINTTVRRQMI
ncbi:efflux RND transporter permease subunit [Azorhizobium caulinodans]|uniref:efflux RND transporter permease subunit n=1 Tax=Azorhizobium caulinodans TaxID=7 RepID=UPI002FBEE44D